MINIENILEKYFGEDEAIILACSTGADSMFLLYKILETKYAKNLVACYFNHKIREESDIEEKFLEDLGKEKGFKVEIAECKIKEIKERFYPNMGIEEVARNKRYEFLNAILNIYDGNKIITGHHLDDKLETFFFNLSRGTKITGLINMREFSDNILRPLINLEKNEIKNYLEENNLKYFEDETNKDTKITRNKIRHDILPGFKDVNSKYKSNINNFINYLEEVKNHLDKQVEDFLYEQGVKVFNSGKYKINTLDIYGYFYIKDFLNLSSLLQKEIIKNIYFKTNNKSTIGLSEANINEVIRFIKGKNNKTKKDLGLMEMKKENEIIIY